MTKANKAVINDNGKNNENNGNNNGYDNNNNDNSDPLISVSMRAFGEGVGAGE